MPRTWRRLAPRLARALREAGEDPERLYLGRTEARSVRGVEAVQSLVELSVPATADLRRVSRLPLLRELTIEGTPDARVQLADLAGAPALELLRLYHLDARCVGAEALAASPSLRVLEVVSSRAPDLRPFRGTALRRLELDGVRGLRPAALAGLGVAELDLWGCGLSDIEVLASMPNLREVWLHGNAVPSLLPLSGLGPGARVVLDGRFDPDAHRPEIEALEARGAWIAVVDDPHAHGIVPSWWGDGARWVDPDGRAPIRYVTRGDGGLQERVRSVGTSRSRLGRVLG
jgi:hypothetical protein